MDKIETCYKLLMTLENDMRYWGRIVNDFMDNYKSLKLNERELLSQKVPVSIRFGLMIQYLGHFNRICKNLSQQELFDLIENAIFLISLDNFEYDYRETILRVQPFIESTNMLGVTFQEVWAQLDNQMPEKTINRIKHFIEK